MKTYFLLILTAITLSFTTAYFALNFDRNNVASIEDIQQFQESMKIFGEKNTPMMILDLSSMYPSRDYFQLIHPISLYTKNSLLEKSNVMSKSCVKTNEQMSKLSFDKNEIWENLRCKRISELPPNFFESPPLIHENGMSYAYLAYLSGSEPFINIDWIKGNLNFFHVSELELLPAESLEKNFVILSKLEKRDFEEIVKGQKFILSLDYFLVRVDNDSDIKFDIYSTTQLESFFKNKSFWVKSYDEESQCFYRDGSLCWVKDSKSITELFRQSSLIVFLTSVLVLFFVLLILFQKMRTQRYEDERKKHALRVLTHELRTPISNLLLQVENINSRSDLLPASVLEDFLKIESEVYRLKRLAEKSSSYLQSHEGKSLISLSRQKIESFNQFIFEIVKDYEDQDVAFVPSIVDTDFLIDIYWFNICLKNLIENALVHGKKPIEVKVHKEDSSLIIAVTDSGDIPFKTLSEVMNSDRSGKNSQGLGLGLSIVKKILNEMEGQLVFATHPTQFSIKLGIKK